MSSCVAAYDKSKASSFIAVRTLVLTVIFTGALVAPQAASAEPLTLAISSASLVASPGSTVTFTGTIRNDTGVALNALDLFANFFNFNPVILTPTQLLGTPNFVIPNGTTSPVVNLFSVALASSATAGSSYSLNVFFQDIDTNESNILTVSVTVAGATPVPEPATFLLLSSGIVGAMVARKKRYDLSHHK